MIKSTVKLTDVNIGDGDLGDQVNSDGHEFEYSWTNGASAVGEPPFSLLIDCRSKGKFEFVSYINLNFSGQTIDQMETKIGLHLIRIGDLLSPKQISLEFSLSKETLQVAKFTSIKYHRGVEGHCNTFAAYVSHS